MISSSVFSPTVRFKADITVCQLFAVVLFVFASCICQSNVYADSPEDGSQQESKQPEEKKKAKVKKRIPEYLIAEKPWGKASDYKSLPKPPRKARMNRSRLQRLYDLKIRLKQKVREQNKILWEKHYRDKRGESEVTICSFNLGEYGLKKEVKRFVSRKAAKKSKVRKKQYLSAIHESDCDIVVLQGLLGRDLMFKLKAMEGIKKGLEKLSGEPWDGAIAASNVKVSANAYVFKSNVARFLEESSETDKRLPRFSKFNKRKFFRSPQVLILQVKGRGVAEKKVIMLYNFHFQGKKPAEAKVRERGRMQMAEALRQLVDFYHRKDVERFSPITIVLGERGSDMRSASAKILEGRLRLEDFRKDGPCVLDEDKKFQCSNKPKHVTRLFSLFLHNLRKSRKLLQSKDEEGKTVYSYEKGYRQQEISERNKLLRQTADILMFSRDLKYANLFYREWGEFNVGSVIAEPLRQDSPLVWVKLNW